MYVLFNFHISDVLLNILPELEYLWHNTQLGGQTAVKSSLTETCWSQRGALKVQKVESKVPNDFHIRRETEKWSPIHRNCCRKISILSSEKWKLSPFFHFTLRSNYPHGKEYFTTGMHHFFMIQKVAGSLSCLWMLSGSRTNSALRRVFLQWEEPKFNLLISGQYGLYQLLEAWVSKAVNEGKVTSSSFIIHT